MTPDTQAWMNRVDKKLDEIGKAIVSLARAEERIVTIFQRIEGMEVRQARMGERIEVLEKTSDQRTMFFTTTERLFWIFVSAAIGAAMYYLR